MHRDIKPQNILVTQDRNLKVADFGLARAFTIPVRPYTSQVVTLWYRAPEVLLEAQEYSTPIDVWSVGCILAELANKAPLFTGDSEIDQIFRIFRVLGTPTEKEWAGLKNCKKFQPIYPHYDRKRMTTVVPHLEELGIDLLEVNSQAHADLRPIQAHHSQGRP